MAKVPDMINFFSNRTSQIKSDTLEAQLAAFLPAPDSMPETENLITRNVAQIGRLITATQDQATELDKVIADASALRRDVQQSLAAWQAAWDVLNAASAGLADRIKAAAAEVDTGTTTVVNASDDVTAAVTAALSSDMTQTATEGAPDVTAGPNAPTDGDSIEALQAAFPPDGTPVKPAAKPKA